MKLKYLIFALFLSACSSSSDKPHDRKIASDEIGFTKKEYYQNRGNGHSKFDYDGYKPGKGKFIKTMLSGKNRKLVKVSGGHRQYLFENNLFDTGSDNKSGVDCNEVMKTVHRTPMGRCYFHNMEDKLSKRDKDLALDVMMGSRDQRFGRNFPSKVANKASRADMMNPNPLEISARLLNRKDGKVQEAEVINVLAAAWLQSMNHDWFSHGKNSKKRHHTIKGSKSHPHFKEGMKVPATASETEDQKKTDNHGYDYVSRNVNTHWWDASQIYGSDAETILKVRGKYRTDGTHTGQLMPDGKIAVDKVNKRLIYGKDGLPITGFHDNWWLGLELIHTLFHLEHNYIVESVLKPLRGKKICKKVSREECAEEMFQKARLINAALLAKIHTVEWTPALLDTPVLHVGMRSNWFGMKEGLGVSSSFLRGALPKSLKHLVSGLTGKKTLDLYSTPFTLTEEFVAVYRMHPLVPEDVKLRKVYDPNYSSKMDVKDMVFRNAQKALKSQTTSNLLYSFGTSHPGALTLHNYPSFMQNFTAERNTGNKHGDSASMDMGAIDIFRDRERGVPRYNAFRRALGLPEMANFEELTSNEEDLKILKELYNDDIEKVDLIVGSLAEKDRYPGYAFGNTPFYIFAVMASRRLMADPFFSDYFTKEYYTKPGMKHVNKEFMTDVIVRHFPEMRGKFYANKEFTRTNHGKKGGAKKTKYTKNVRVVKNAFRPWLPVYTEVKKQLDGAK